jgi:AcrR family transcriptional regulator
MSIRNDRREAAIDRMADYVLAEGMGSATLRPLAAAAGTSDRMLLYYFADKDELLTAVLNRIAARLLGKLAAAVAGRPPRAFATLLKEVWTVLGVEALEPYMNIWLDLTSAASRGLQPHRNVAGAITDGYLMWVASQLEPSKDSGRPEKASLLLAAVQGMYSLNAIGRGHIAESALLELLG